MAGGNDIKAVAGYQGDPAVPSPTPCQAATAIGKHTDLEAIDHILRCFAPRAPSSVFLLRRRPEKVEPSWT